MSQFSAAAATGRRLSITTTTQPLKRPSARPWSPNGASPARSFTMQQQTSGFHSGGCNGSRSCTCPFFDESNAHEWPKCVQKKQAMMQRQSSTTMAAGTTTGAASRMQQTRAFNTSAKQSSASSTTWSQSSNSTSDSKAYSSQPRGGNDAWDGLTFS